MNDEALRSEFEAWYDKQYADVYELCPNLNKVYPDPIWEAWQACAEAWAALLGAGEEG